MNRDRYKSAFYSVSPSEQVTERIMSMTNKVKNTKRILVTVLAVIGLLVGCLISVNAATDGVVTDTLTQTAEKISSEIKIFVNGKQISSDNVKESVDENGNVITSGNIEVPEADGSTSIAGFKIEGNGVIEDEAVYSIEYETEVTDTTGIGK